MKYYTYILLTLIYVNSVQAQIRGRVVSATTSSPVPGATIELTRSGYTSFTGDDGWFSIPNPQTTDSLFIRHIGYETFSCLIFGDFVGPLNVVLNPVHNILERVEINAGYYKVKALDRTGNIVNVDGAIISRQPVSDPILALSGRVSGLLISQTSGITGGAANVQIRGRNSIDQGNEPLYVIDGVPFASQGDALLGSSIGPQGNSPFTFLNQGDIESIVVAKDADATAIYGSRGANGVVLITTKRGVQGQSKLSLNVNSGISQITRFIDLMNTREYVAMRKEAFDNDGRAMTLTTAPDILAWDTTRYTDLVNELIGGTAKSSNATLSLSGGSMHTRFLISSGFYRQTTVFPTDLDYKRTNLGLNVSHSSDDQRLQLTVSSNYGYEINKLPSSDITNSVRRPPNLPPLYKQDGDLNWSENGYSFDNPLGVLRRQYTLKTENLIGNLRTSYMLTDRLIAQLNLGFSSRKSNELRINPIAAYDPALNRTGNASHGRNISNGLILEPQLNYSSEATNGGFNVLVGGAWQQNTSTSLTIDATGYESDVMIQSINAASSVSSRNAFEQYRYVGLFGRVSYNHLSKYLISLTGRRDGSSRFGPGRRFATFGSIGGAWLFSKEAFMDGQSFITTGKVRSSFGITGSDAIGNYQYLDTYSVANNPYDGQPSIYPTRLYNPDFAWESNRKFEAAIEIGVLQDKFFFTGAYYNNRSSNQLVQSNLPGQTGFLSITQNLPALIQNRGIELEVDASFLRTEWLSWDASVNLTFPKTQLLAFPELKGSSYQNRLVLGESLNLGSGFRLNGINPETGTYEFLNAQNQITNNPIRAEDLIVDMVNLDPEWFGGFSNSFRISRVHIDVFLEFRKQLGYSYLRDFTQAPGTMFNQPRILLERWTHPGSNGAFQKYTALASSEASRINALMVANGSDTKYTDASYIRLKNVVIAYNISSSLTKKLGIDACNFYLQCQNLLTITTYKGNDPETQSNLRLPPLRTITAGIKLNI